MRKTGTLLKGLAGLLILAGIAGFVSSKTKKRPALKQVGSIDLPGPGGRRFDYLTIDYRHNYLLSAHLEADVTYVIDLRTNKLVKVIEDTPGIEGIEYAPNLNKTYTSNWNDNSIGVIDMDLLKVVKKIPALSKPDGNTYAAPFKKLYVSDERAKALLVVDANRDTIINQITFGSETGMPQYDSLAKKVYLNLQDENLFVVIDPATDKVLGSYPVGECSGNHGMALDETHQLAFLICEHNDVMTVMNLKTFKPVAFIKLPSGGDVVKYDPGLKRIYVACYSGAIAVIQEVDPLHFKNLQEFKVEKRVHSLAVDKITHKVYAPEEEESGKPVSKMIVFDAIP